MTDSLFTGLVEQTKELLHAVRGSLIHVGANLYQIKTSEEWKQYETTWGAFCEGTLQISQSQASKLLSIHEHFVLKGGMDTKELEGVDYEKLNTARSLSGSPQEQLAKAKTLSRSELREEKVDDGHIHSGEIVQIHKCCGMRIS